MTDEIITIASAFTSTLAPFLPKIIGTATKLIGDGFEEFVKEGGKTYSCLRMVFLHLLALLVIMSLPKTS